jgi:hypothetical protein
MADNVIVIPKCDPGIHHHYREYGFPVCAVGASRNDGAV